MTSWRLMSLSLTVSNLSNVSRTVFILFLSKNIKNRMLFLKEYYRKILFRAVRDRTVELCRASSEPHLLLGLARSSKKSLRAGKTSARLDSNSRSTSPSWAGPRSLRTLFLIHISRSTIQKKIVFLQIFLLITVKMNKSHLRDRKLRLSSSIAADFANEVHFKIRKTLSKHFIMFFMVVRLLELFKSDYYSVWGEKSQCQNHLILVLNSESNFYSSGMCQILLDMHMDKMSGYFCIFRWVACEKWRKHFFCITPGHISWKALMDAISKFPIAVSGLGFGEIAFNLFDAARYVFCF